MTSYKNLSAWKKAMLLVKEVYVVTKMFPKEELYALTSQTKRAVISIPANIAEGVGRNYKKDTIQFLYISRGSLYEVETLLNVALVLDFISEDVFNGLAAQIDEVLKILNGLIRSYEERLDLK